MTFFKPYVEEKQNRNDLSFIFLQLYIWTKDSHMFKII